MEKAGQFIDVSRSNVYEQSNKDPTTYRVMRVNPNDQEIIAHIRQLKDERPTYRNQRITAFLRKS